MNRWKIENRSSAGRWPRAILLDLARNLCAAFFSGKIGHSERSEESRPRHEENEILRCAQNDGIAYLPENMAAHRNSHYLIPTPGFTASRMMPPGCRAILSVMTRTSSTIGSSFWLTSSTFFAALFSRL